MEEGKFVSLSKAADAHDFIARILGMGDLGECNRRTSLLRSGISRMLTPFRSFDRRFRVYDISDFGETIRTYKRTEHDEIIDDMILAGKGAPEI